MNPKQLFRFLVLCSLTFFSSAIALDWQWDVGASYRVDRLMWESGGQSTKVGSRLTWKNIEIYEIQSNLSVITCNDVYLSFQGDYGKVFQGGCRDSDYYKYKGKVYEYSRSENRANRGHVYDGSVAVGYFFRECLGLLQLIPLIGYSWHGQKFFMSKGHFVIDLTKTPNPKNFSANFNSHYSTRWNGLWLGVVSYYQQCRNLVWKGQCEYHWADYRGCGHWNLRKDFLSDFHQKGFGHGFLLSIGLNYSFWNRWYVEVMGRYQEMHVRDGHQKLWVDSAYYSKLEKGAPNTKQASKGRIAERIRGRIPRVRWHSYSLGLALGYYF